MGDRSAIEWTEATWNPTRGCSRVSEGCRHCYAEVIAARFSGKGRSYTGLARRTADGEARWTGEVHFIPEALDLPLRWRRPRRIFVNSMSDLFHEKIPDEWIDRVFAVMARAPQHTFQALTKRPERMLAYCTVLGKSFARLKSACPVGWTMEYRGIPLVPWPLQNVWLGVSVEDQATADERIPLLLQTPAAVRFVSYEPALAGVDFTRLAVEPEDGTGVDALRGERVVCGGLTTLGARIDWLIVGGESGPGARPFDLAWARSAIRQCRAAGTPVFVKQLGAVPTWDGCGLVVNNPPGKTVKDVVDGREVRQLLLCDRKGGDWSEWPEDLKVREWPAWSGR